MDKIKCLPLEKEKVKRNEAVYLMSKVLRFILYIVKNKKSFRLYDITILRRSYKQVSDNISELNSQHLKAGKK